MTNKEKLYEAAKLLQDNCNKPEKRCAGCLFFIKSQGCALINVRPDCWNIKKPRRFTDEDIALARALKAFGAKYIGAKYIDQYGRYCSVWSINENCSGVLPANSFTDLGLTETVLIDDIVKEGENNA